VSVDLLPQDPGAPPRLHFLGEVKSRRPRDQVRIFRCAPSCPEPPHQVSPHTAVRAFLFKGEERTALLRCTPPHWLRTVFCCTFSFCSAMNFHRELSSPGLVPSPSVPCNIGFRDRRFKFCFPSLHPSKPVIALFRLRARSPVFRRPLILPLGVSAVA